MLLVVYRHLQTMLWGGGVCYPEAVTHGCLYAVAMRMERAQHILTCTNEPSCTENWSFRC